jgi:cytochrome o ubiquinol oxidase subunit IV
MTDTRWDVAPGDRPTIPTMEQGTSSGFLVYTIGLVVAAILTITSFWVANTSAIWSPGVPAGLVVLAIAQMGVHLVFFLHITTGPDNTNNILALAFGVLIVFLVLIGSLVIMANLNENMMAHSHMSMLHLELGSSAGQFIAG